MLRHDGKCVPHSAHIPPGVIEVKGRALLVMVVTGFRGVMQGENQPDQKGVGF